MSFLGLSTTARGALQFDNTTDVFFLLPVLFGPLLVLGTTSTYTCDENHYKCKYRRRGPHN
eukprot:436223-Amphidinium_carterae.1